MVAKPRERIPMHARTHDHLRHRHIRHDRLEDNPQSDLSRAFQDEIRDGLEAWRHNHRAGSELSVPVDPQRDHVCGDPAAPVVVVEYGSYGSPGGSKEDLAFRATLRDWLDEGKICLALRHFPLIDSYPSAWLAAQAAEAAGCQGRFWEMHEALTDALTRPWSKEIDRREIVDLARRLELDVDRLSDDLERPSAIERIVRDFNSGVTSGVNGAPSFYVQGVRQDIDEPKELHAKLESALAGDMASLWPPVHRRAGRHVEIARLWHDGFADRDVSGSARFWADDIEWRGWNEELPGGGSATGKASVEELQRALPAGSDLQMVAQEYIQQGDRVLVIGEASRDSEGGGFAVPYVQIWEMEAGKAKRVQTLADTLVMARAFEERASAPDVRSSR
jgi:protein-disulfide isomerase/ketosteroid isomerase-like protein